MSKASSTKSGRRPPLTDPQVILLRRMHAAGMSPAEIERCTIFPYDVVYRTVTGRAYKDVGGPIVSRDYKGKTVENLAELAERHRQGETLVDLAEETDVTASTLGRKLRKNGFAVRTAGYHLRLFTDKQVREARVLHAQGRSVKSIWRMLEQEHGVEASYATVHLMVNCKTYRHVRTKCVRCQILTTHDSGYCRFCREEGRHLVDENKKLNGGRDG